MRMKYFKFLFGYSSNSQRRYFVIYCIVDQIDESIVDFDRLAVDFGRLALDLERLALDLDRLAVDFDRLALEFWKD